MSESRPNYFNSEKFDPEPDVNMNNLIVGSSFAHIILLLNSPVSFKCHITVRVIDLTPLCKLFFILFPSEHVPFILISFKLISILKLHIVLDDISIRQPMKRHTENLQSVKGLFALKHFYKRNILFNL